MEEKTKLWYLENFNLLKTLSAQEKSYIDKNSSMCDVPKGNFIYFQQDESDIVYFLKKGRVKIAKYVEDGREVIFSILGAGELFGELSLLSDGGQREELAEAMEDCVLCKVPVHEFNTILESNSKMSLAVTKLIGLKLIRVQNKLQTMWFKKTSDRVHSFLNILAEKHGRKVGDEIEIRLGLTHQDIANLTATNRQTVTTILRDLQSRNIILYDRRRILVRKPEALNSK